MFYVFHPFPPAKIVTSYPDNQDHPATAKKLHDWLRCAFPCGVVMELDKLMVAERERCDTFVRDVIEATKLGPEAVKRFLARS